MTDITIQQTLKIVDGRVSPSVEPIDGDLVEISKEPNNAIEIKEDGLYVPTVTVSENPETTLVAETAVVREVASNGSYKDKLSPSKSLQLILPIDPDMVDQYSQSLKEDYVVDLTPYNFKYITNVVQKATLPEGINVDTAVQYKETVENGFIKNIKINNLAYVSSSQIVTLAPISTSGTQNGNPTLYPIVEGMCSISGYSSGNPILAIEVDGVEVYRFQAGYYNLNELVPYTFKKGQIVTLKDYGADGNTLRLESTQVVTGGSVVLDQTPLVGQSTLQGTATPNATFTIVKQNPNALIEITADSTGHWNYTFENQFLLNEYILFYENDVFVKAIYVENNPAVDLTVKVYLRIDGILAETLEIEPEVYDTFLVEDIENDSGTSVALPAETTKLFKIKKKKGVATDDFGLRIPCLDIFKSIRKNTCSTKRAARTPQGGNYLESSIYNAVINQLADNFFLRDGGYQETSATAIYFIEGATVGSQYFSIFFDGQGAINVQIDGVDFFTTPSYTENKLPVTLNEGLKEGQKIVVTYRSSSTYEILETLTWIVGQEPVLTLNRPPFTDYSEEIEHIYLEVTGMLK